MDQKRDVFISYHTSTALDIVSALGEKLENQGISCWYAPRDCEGNFEEAIISALNKASIFLLIINQGSMQSEQVKNEIHAAFTRYSQKHMYITLFQTDNCPVNDTVQYFLGRIHRINGIQPPMEERIDEVVHRITYIKNQLRLNSEFFADCESRILSTVLTPSPLFVGRQREQREIFEFLDKYKKIFVSGMAGIGKSQLVRQFAITYKTSFRSVSWASYDTDLKSLIVSDENIKISNFSRSSSQESKDEYFIRKYDYLLKNFTEEDLLIIDNFDVTTDECLDKILNLPAKIIFTTRIKQGNNYFVDRIESDDELFELFTKCYPRTLDEKDKNIVKNIIKFLCGHTLAIRMVASIMRNNRISPQKMSEALSINTVDALDKITYNDTHEQLSLIFNMSNLSEKERAIIYNLSFFPVSGIETVEFFDLCKLDSYETIDGLIDKNWILHDAAKDFISVHPIICDICLKMPYSDQLSRTFIDSFIKVASEYNLDSFERTSLWLYVAQSINTVLPKTSEIFKDFVWATDRLFHAVSMHDTIIKMEKLLLETDLQDLERIDACLKIANAYRCKEIKDSLYEYIVKAENILSLSDCSQTQRAYYQSIIYSNYGWYYYYANEKENSLTAFRKKFEIDVKWHSDDFEKIGWSYFNVGVAYDGIDNFSESFQYLSKACEIFSDHNFKFGIACCNKSLAHSFIKQKQYGKAMDCIQKALELFLKTVGENQTDTALCYWVMHLIYSESNEHEKSEQMRVKACNIFKAIGMESVFENLVK